MFVWVVPPHLASEVPFDGVLGVKPPWNHPQVTPLSLSTSPMFLPVICTVEFVAAGFVWSEFEQSS